MAANPDAIDLLGIRIDRVTTIQVLGNVKKALDSDKRAVIATVNTEFILRGLENPAFRELINASDLSVADGSGVQWAANFLARPRRPPLISWGQAIFEGFETLSLRHAAKIIPERIPGSRLLWDIASFSAKNNYRLYLLGGIGGVAELTGQRLKQRYPKLIIAGVGEGSRSGEEESQAKAILAAKADIVLVAFGSPYQEEWIARTARLLPRGVFIGVGGSFDFVARGASRDGGRLAKAFPARQTPGWVQSLGLGFLWRLIAQPWRLRRVWRAAPYFMYKVVQYKGSQNTN